MIKTHLTLNKKGQIINYIKNYKNKNCKFSNSEKRESEGSKSNIFVCFFFFIIFTFCSAFFFFGYKMKKKGVLREDF